MEKKNIADYQSVSVSGLGVEKPEASSEAVEMMRTTDYSMIRYVSRDYKTR